MALGGIVLGVNSGGGGDACYATPGKIGYVICILFINSYL
jgi:hypothetical protein